jgi:hypothetical protein
MQTALCASLGKIRSEATSQTSRCGTFPGLSVREPISQDSEGIIRRAMCWGHFRGTSQSKMHSVSKTLPAWATVFLNKARCQCVCQHSAASILVDPEFVFLLKQFGDVVVRQVCVNRLTYIYRHHTSFSAGVVVAYSWMLYRQFHKVISSDRRS